MAIDFGRRDILKASAAIAGAAAAGRFACVEIANAATIEVPTVDKLAIRVLVDSSFDNFFRPGEVRGVTVAPAPRAADFRRTLHNEWGLSLWLESQRGGEQRTLMLDYGYTPAVLLNNMELVGVDPSQDQCPDRQPRPFRPLRRTARLPGKVPQRAAGRRQALCRGRGQFLPPLVRDRNARPVQRFRCARPPRAHRAKDRHGAVRNPDRDRRPRLHDRQDQAQQPRARAAATPSWNSAPRTGSAAIPVTTCRPKWPARSCPTSTSTSTPLASTSRIAASW